MRLQGRLKRSTKQYIIVAVLCLIVIGGAGILTTLVITSQIKQEYQELLDEAQKELEQNQRNVYVAAANIISGDVLTKEALVKKEVYSSQPLEDFISEEKIGKLALIDIPEGTLVLNTMVTDSNISSHLREAEYEVIHMNSNIISDDIVDVRIQYPNGESYVVISKKIMKGVVHETATCFFWLEEEELLRMSAAIVDAALYNGTQLVTTKYIEPNIQDASVITYTPSLQVLGMIEKDPNIVKRSSQELNKRLRKSLENRLAASLSIDVAAADWDVNDNEFMGGVVQEEDMKATNSDLPDHKTVKNTEQALNTQTEDELGDEQETNVEQDYLYYADEEKAKEGVLEYGE